MNKQVTIQTAVLEQAIRAMENAYGFTGSRQIDALLSSSLNALRAVLQSAPELDELVIHPFGIDGKEDDYVHVFGTAKMLKRLVAIHEQFKAAAKPPAQAGTSSYATALDIRAKQGWKINGGPVPVLYTDEINGTQVCRDDVWLARTADLDKKPPAHAVNQGLVEALKAVRDRFFPVGQPKRDRDDLWELVNTAIAQAQAQPASEPMTDEELKTLTERGAKAWAGVDPQDLRSGAEPAGEVDADVDWAAVGRIIDTHAATRGQFVAGTSNWGAAIYRAAIQKGKQP